MATSLSRAVAIGALLSLPAAAEHARAANYVNGILDRAPFAAIRKDEFVHGCGAQDDKGNLTAGLIGIFLAESGEEGTTKPGIDYMVSRHWPEIYAEFAMAECGYISARKGKVRFAGIAFTEAPREPASGRYFARHEPGHFSILLPDEDVDRFCATQLKLIDDPHIEVVAPRPRVRRAVTSRLDTEMFAAMEKTQRRMFPGATDMAQLRAKVLK